MGIATAPSARVDAPEAPLCLPAPSLQSSWKSSLPVSCPAVCAESEASFSRALRRVAPLVLQMVVSDAYQVSRKTTHNLIALFLLLPM
jgi:hypothetical protein